MTYYSSACGAFAIVIIAIVAIAFLIAAVIAWSVLALMVAEFFMPMMAWWQWLILGFFASVISILCGAALS